MDYGVGPSVQHMHSSEVSALGLAGISPADLAAPSQLHASMQAAGPSSSLHSNLYVKGFGADWDEPTLQSYFAPYGVIECIRIVKNVRPLPGAVARQAYGFVKLQNVDQARAAIAALNGCTLGPGLLLEVKFADADAGIPTSLSGQQPSDNLYIRNLGPGWNEVSLAELFLPFGAVRECRVLHTGDKTKGGGALVRMGTADEAARAIDGLNNSYPPGAALPLLVRFADTPEEKARKMAKKERFVPRYTPYGPPQQQQHGGLMQRPPPDPVQGGLLGQSSSLPAGFTAFDSGSAGPFGGPATASVQPRFDSGFDPSPGPYDPMQPGVSYDRAAFDPTAGGGYDPYGQQQQSVTAAGPGAGPYLNGGDVGVISPYQSGASGTPSNGHSLLLQQSNSGPQPSSIYIKNLPPETDKLYLYEKFAPFGGVASVKVLADEATGQCRGVGFVNYVDSTSAMQAVGAMHNLRMGERILHVSLQTHRMR